MRRLRPDASGLEVAAALLREGQLVAFPTETVYGLGALATDADAVLGIFAAKGRPRFDPLIVHVGRDLGSLSALAARGVVDSAALSPADVTATERLIAAHWPGPLTLLLPRGRAIPDVVTAGLPTVGVRVPDHPVALALLEALDAPVAAPSANRFGQISPTDADAVSAELGLHVAALLDGGQTTVGVESCVVRLAADAVEVLRPGAITLASLAASAGRPARRVRAHLDETALAREAETALSRGTANAADAGAGAAPTAPGQLARHYAPRTPLVVWDGSPAGAPQSGDGYLARDPDRAARFGQPGVVTEVLSPDHHTPGEAQARQGAKRLFAAMRRLDGAGLRRIVADVWPEDDGLSSAIADRLGRASAGSGSAKDPR